MTIFRWYPLPEAIDWATRGREAALSAGTVSLVFLVKFLISNFIQTLRTATCPSRIIRIVLVDRALHMPGHVPSVVSYRRMPLLISIMAPPPRGSA
jgi:hypothetical protein